MKLPDEVLYAIKKIMNSGGQAYLVGGALRDSMLGRAVYDYDIATSLTPDETEAVFSEHKSYPIGKRFGTITVLIDNHPIEITTFRGEDSYTDSRHPDRVVFISDIRADLSRRDFTINAMAYNPYLESAIVDLYNGRDDLNNRLIKTVGAPELRFSEDPLRIMRGIRFAAQLNFELSQEVFMAVINLKHLLKKIAVERIKDEFTKLLMAEHAAKGLCLLQSTGILSLLFDNNGRENINALNDTEFLWIESISDKLVYRLSTLFYLLLPYQSTSKNLMQRLRFDNTTTNQVVKLLDGYRLFLSMDITPYTMRKFVGEMGFQDTRHILCWYHRLDSCDDSNTALRSKSQRALQLLDDIISNNNPVFFNQLAITGEDVLELGIGDKDGRLIGDALRKAYQWILENPENNKKDILLKKLKDNYL